MTEQQKQARLKGAFDGLSSIVDDAFRGHYSTRDCPLEDRADYGMLAACNAVCDDPTTAATLEAVFNAYAAAVGAIDTVVG